MLHIQSCRSGSLGAQIVGIGLVVEVVDLIVAGYSRPKIHPVRSGSPVILLKILRNLDLAFRLDRHRNGGGSTATRYRFRIRIVGKYLCLVGSGHHEHFVLSGFIFRSPNVFGCFVDKTNVFCIFIILVSRYGFRNSRKLVRSVGSGQMHTDGRADRHHRTVDRRAGLDRGQHIQLLGLSSLSNGILFAARDYRKDSQRHSEYCFFHDKFDFNGLV